MSVIMKIDNDKYTLVIDFFVWKLKMLTNLFIASDQLHSVHGRIKLSAVFFFFFLLFFLQMRFLIKLSVRCGILSNIIAYILHYGWLSTSSVCRFVPDKH